MATLTSTEVKRRFGEVMETARREPVVVQSHGRDTVVIIDHEEYARLKSLEDAYWVARAQRAEESGYLSPEESMNWLTERLANTSNEE
jgi:prevent-host-death family protein